MSVLDLETVRRLAAPGVVIPLVRELSCQELDPLVAFARLSAGSRHAALLETSEAAAADADISIVAPTARAVLHGDDVLERVQAACAPRIAEVGVELPRFVGGAIGMLGHEHVCTIETRVRPAAAPHPAQAPTAAFLLVDTILVFEHRHQRVRAIHALQVADDAGREDLDAAYAAGIAALDELERRLQAPDVEDAAATTVPLLAPESDDAFDGVTANLPPGRFQELVQTAREHVLDGECVQVVVSQRFDVPCTADPLLAYRALRATSPAPYHVLLRLDDVHVVGASPEQLVGVQDERVVTFPIAGTRPRGTSEQHDRALEAELLADPKERSEHMMLVDLGRNDVGRVARPGTVRVERLCEIERYSHVMHLVSRVSGTLHPSLQPVDALRAAFPAGTLSGAPKVRALQLIAELEPDQRGPYGGVIGYVGHGRVLDAAITIRSAVLTPGRAFVQAGAGVVAGSNPDAEEAETRHKATAVLRALQRAERVSRSIDARPTADGVAAS